MNEACETARARFAQLAENALGESEAEAVRAHLQRCDACREEFAGIVEVIRELRAVPAPEIPRERWDEMRGAVSRQMEEARCKFAQAPAGEAGADPAARARRRLRIRRWAVGLAAAAALLLVLAAWDRLYHSDGIVDTTVKISARDPIGETGRLVAFRLHPGHTAHEGQSLEVRRDGARIGHGRVVSVEADGRTVIARVDFDPFESPRNGDTVRLGD